MGSHQKHFGETLLMSTHNMFSWKKIRKYWYFLVEKKRGLIWSYAQAFENIVELGNKMISYRIENK